MSEKESRGFSSIDKIKRSMIKGIAPVAITPALAIGIHGSIVDHGYDQNVTTPQTQHQIYNNETLDEKYAQIIWHSQNIINEQRLESNIGLGLSPDQLSLGTKIAVTLGLLSLLSYSVAKASEFSNYAHTHQKYAMWAGVSLQAAASLAIIVEAFK